MMYFIMDVLDMLGLQRVSDHIEKLLREKRWSKMGQFFGYPECCVKQFTKDACQATKDQYPEGPWMGTGFIPCSCCADKALKDWGKFQSLFQKNRKAPKPFPNDDF